MILQKEPENVKREYYASSGFSQGLKTLKNDSHPHPPSGCALRSEPSPPPQGGGTRKFGEFSGGDAARKLPKPLALPGDGDGGMRGGDWGVALAWTAAEIYLVLFAGADIDSAIDGGFTIWAWRTPGIAEMVILRCVDQVGVEDIRTRRFQGKNKRGGSRQDHAAVRAGGIWLGVALTRGHFLGVNRQRESRAAPRQVEVDNHGCRLRGGRVALAQPASRSSSNP